MLLVVTYSHSLLHCAHKITFPTTLMSTAYDHTHLPTKQYCSLVTLDCNSGRKTI